MSLGQQVDETIKTLHNELQGKTEKLRVAQNIIDTIPRCYADGTGILSPADWIKYAKKALGDRGLERT